MNMMVPLVKVGLAVIVVAASVRFADAVKETSLTTIFGNREKFHGTTVIVHGIASRVERKISRKGRPYTRFFLTEPASKARIEIDGPPYQTVAEGTSVMVEGIYHMSVSRDGPSFGDWIEAYSIRNRRDIRKQVSTCHDPQQGQMGSPARWFVSHFPQCMRGLLAIRSKSLSH